MSAMDHLYATPYGAVHDLFAEVADNVTQAHVARAAADQRPRRVPSRTPFLESVFLDLYDASGEHEEYVGCAPDRRSAKRMRVREAAQRGISEYRIRFSTVKGA